MNSRVQQNSNETPGVFLSVIVCTRNRSGELQSCLGELLSQAQKFSDIELVVVDNGSTDNTAEVVGAMAASHAQVIYVFEPEPGSARARNRGRQAARGHVIAYIDDDEIARPGWIERIRSHFLEDLSDCLAGRIGVVLEGKPPKGLTRNLHWILGELDLGDETRAIHPPDYPQTGNCAMKADVFDAVGGFNPHLMLYGDDTELFSRIYSHNFSIIYDPKVAIDQRVPVERLSEQTLKKKAYGWGRGAAMFWLLSSPTRTQRLFKTIEYTARTVYVAGRWCMSPAFGRYFTFWHNCGKLRQLIAGVR